MRKNSEGNWISIGICIIAVLAIIFMTNSCSASDWNNGTCPECNVRYELRGTSNGLKYYACPECGKEVEKY